MKAVPMRAAPQAVEGRGPEAMQELAEIFQQALRDMIFPSTSMLSIMATLGKKGGGTRCITVCSSTPILTSMPRIPIHFQLAMVNVLCSYMVLK